MRRSGRSLPTIFHLHSAAESGETNAPEVPLCAMNLKYEALKVIREQVGDRGIGLTTTVAALTEKYETSIEQLVEALESEFGVELSEELVVDAETVGDLCALVARADE